ncbi:13813_t:CDS:2, partial [Acaulospora colombiana]
PPPQQSGSSGPSFPPPNWVVPNANQTAGYGAPALPPRPNAYPGTPGGSNTGPQGNTLLGGIYKQATGVVDRVAGENTRMQLESGVLRAAQR